MNTGCYKITSLFFIIERAPTTIVSWYQSTKEEEAGEIWEKDI